MDQLWIFAPVCENKEKVWHQCFEFRYFHSSWNCSFLCIKTSPKSWGTGHYVQEWISQKILTSKEVIMTEHISYIPGVQNMLAHPVLECDIWNNEIFVKKCLLKWDFCENCDFWNAIFVKNVILKMWFLWKIGFWNVIFFFNNSSNQFWANLPEL